MSKIALVSDPIALIDVWRDFSSQSQQTLRLSSLISSELGWDFHA